MDREYDFWVLDLDGTVVDVEPDYVHDVCTEVGDRLGVSFTREESRRLWYGYGDGREDVLAKSAVDPERFWATFHDVESPRRRAAATHLYPDAETFVSRISEPIGLVTHCQEYLTEPVLDALDIGDWFDTVVCCSDETGWKPDPGPVELAMADLGVAGNGHRGALVGDDHGDIGAAHNAGLAGIHVDREDSPAAERPADAARVTDLAELVS